MVRIIAPIKPNERSQNVANLHTAIRLLGQRVDPVELRELRAGDTTIALIREFQRRMNLAVREDVLVDEATAAAINSFLADQDTRGTEPILGYSVSGHIVGPDGRPGAGLAVAAYDQDLRTREELGRTVSGGRGDYRIIYTKDKFSRAERGEADLVIEVSAPDGEVLHTTEPFFRAPRHAIIDVVLPSFGKEAELDRMTRLIQPLLERQNVGLDGLEENGKLRDLTFLSQETGVRMDRLMTFAVAFRLQQRSQITASLWYAVLRTETIPPLTPGAEQPSVEEAAERMWAQVPSTSPEAVERAVRRAIELSYIAAPTDQQLEATLKQYRELVRRESENAPNSKARNVADLAGVDARQRDVVFDAVLAGGSRKEIVERLRKARLGDKELAAVDATLTLHDLTLGDAAVLKQLRGSQVDHPDKVRTLARMDQREWEQVLTRGGAEPPKFIAGEKPEEKRKNYAKLLARRFERTYPTAAFAGGLERALKSDRKPPLRQAPAILKFLDTHADFELATTSVDGYLASQGRPERGVDRDAFVKELKAVQRVYKVAPNYAAASALLEDGIHSARKIHRM